MEKISWTDLVRNEAVLLTVKQQRDILHEICKRKANWIGHILRRNCLPRKVIEGKIKGGIEVTGRRGRRRRNLLDDIKERRGYSHLKEEALDRTMWRARFGRGFGPVVRQTAEGRKRFIRRWKEGRDCFSVRAGKSGCNEITERIKNCSVSDGVPVNTGVHTCVVHRNPKYNTNTEHITEIRATHTHTQKATTALNCVACIFRFPSFPFVLYFVLNSLPILLTFRHRASST